MLPFADTTERWRFVRTPDPCRVCGGAPSSQRAFDSNLDLMNEAGRVNGCMPDIELPNGVAGSPRKPLFMASICEPVDRVTIYLQSTLATYFATKSPNPMRIELRIGLDCIPEIVHTVTIWPTAWNDGGKIFTWASMDLFNCIGISGTTIANVIATDPIQRVALRLLLDRAGICCALNPSNGPLTVQPQP